jgi:hypothetical protein
MATFQASLAEAGVPARYQEKGVFAVVSTYTAPASGAPAGGDTIQMMKVQAGVTVIDAFMVFNDMSTAVDATFVVGDGGETNRFIVSTDVDAAAGHARMTKFPHTYTADDTIDITIGGAATALTSAAKVTLVVYMTAEEVDLV